MPCVDLIILGIVVIGVLGVIISAIINRLERIFLGWEVCVVWKRKPRI